MGVTGSRIGCMQFIWPLSDGENIYDKLQVLEQRFSTIEAQHHTMEMKYIEMQSIYEQKLDQQRSIIDALGCQFDRLDSKMSTLDLEYHAILESDMMIIVPNK